MRSIPAWAGKPPRDRRRLLIRWVHPRVGGETAFGLRTATPHGGPSPRGRGNRVRAAHGDSPRGSIPAWAGKPRSGPCASATSPSGVHPRVGGETAGRTHPNLLRPISGPSPRGRGNRKRHIRSVDLRRSIPAWAGKPRAGSAGLLRCRVHPRVGGETLSFSCLPPCRQGPSPRGRGNRPRRPDPTGHEGSIPAWAGKPLMTPK